MANSSKVVSYGKAVLDTLSAKNWEISNFLDNNNFAENGLPIASHVQATFDDSTFTNSTNDLAFYPRTTPKPHDFVKIALFQLLGFTGLDLLVNETSSDETNDTPSGSNDEGPNNETILNAPDEPKIVYAEDDGSYCSRSEEFNTMDIENQIQFINDNDYNIVTREEFDSQMAAYDLQSNQVTHTKGQNYVLIEYLQGKNDPSNTTGYRIWILQECGAKGDISKTMANRIANGRIEKSKKKKKELKYDDTWRQIRDNKSFGETVGSALYQNKNTLKNLHQANFKVLHDRNNPVFPETVLSVGQWQQIINGRGADGISRVNHLPLLYPNDADERRFIYTNYFSQDMQFFQPIEEFRKSFVLVTIRDLQEEYFMDKTRTDIYRSLVYPTIQRNLVKQVQPKPTHGITTVLPTLLQSNPNFQNNLCIHPANSYSLDGQSYPNVNPNDYQSDGIQGKQFLPGSSNTFLYVRAMAHEFLLPYFNNLIKDCKTMEDRKQARIEGMEKALEYVKPIFDGVGNCNVGPGMQGVINVRNLLLKENFNQIFVNMTNVNNDVHFQDNFMSWMLSGAEYYLFLSTLQCDFYTLYINSSCCYLLIRDKTNTLQAGDPGTGKTEVFHALKRTFPPGVCQEVSNESTMAHFFGTDKIFMVKIRNEPDPLRDGGANVRSNPIAMAKTEMEKTILSEQEGKKTISVFDKENSKWVEKVIHVILSIVTVSNTNQGVKSKSKAINDRAYNTYITKKRRLNKGVSYMKSGQSSQSELRKQETNTFIHTMWWINSTLALISAMMDIDCALSDANFLIFDDIQEYLEKHFELNTRSIERCRNTARSQTLYDTVNILLHYKPIDKELKFYIDGNLVHDELNEELGKMYTDETQVAFKHEHHCTLFRHKITNALVSKVDLDDMEEYIEQPCIIDLLRNCIHSKIYNVDEPNARPELLKEQEKLSRKWQYKDIWNSDKLYTIGETCKVHVSGKESNYGSYYFISKCLKPHSNQKPIILENTPYWEFQVTITESLLGKYFQEPIQFEGERATEFFMDVNRLNYCTIDVGLRTFALMRNEFVAESQDKIHREIVSMGLGKLKRIDHSNPFASFYQPREEVRNPTFEGVDLHYIKLDNQNAVVQELREQLKQKLTVGLVVNASDQVLNDTIDKLRHNTYHNVFYKSFGVNRGVNNCPHYPWIETNTSGEETWLFPYDNSNVNSWYQTNDESNEFTEDAVYTLRNEEMKEYNRNSDKKPVLIRKKNVLYVLVAWLDDMDYAVKEEEDHFLSILSQYQYYSSENETKKILVGHAWSGEVDTTDRNNNPIKKKWCDPSISRSISVKGLNSFRKTFREKNVVDSATHLIHGRQKSNTRATTEVVDIHYDDYALKVRLKQLDEFEESEMADYDDETSKSFFQNKYGAYSKITLKKHLNESQPGIFQENFPFSYVQHKFEEETSAPI